MTFYFGSPVAGLVALPHPNKGITPTSERSSTVHASSSGARVVDLASRSGRVYSCSWDHLDSDSYSVLEEFYQDGRGSGPFSLLDPWRRNHLGVNQSAATSKTNDPAGFSVQAGSGEALSSTASRFLRGPRSLRWSLPATLTSGVLDFDPPPGLLGWPLPPGQPWTFSGSVRLGGIISSLSVTPVLSWRSLDSAEVAATLGTPVSAIPGAWTTFSVSLATPPGGALYVRPQLRLAPGVLTAAAPDTTTVYQAPSRSLRGASVAQDGGATGGMTALVAVAPQARFAGMAIMIGAPVVPAELFIDAMQLDMNVAARPWVLGTGVPQVTITALSQSYVITPVQHCAATFVEVG